MPKVHEAVKLLRETAEKLEKQCEANQEVQMVLCPDGGYSGDPEDFPHATLVEEAHEDDPDKIVYVHLKY